MECKSAVMKEVNDLTMSVRNRPPAYAPTEDHT